MCIYIYTITATSKPRDSPGPKRNIYVKFSTKSAVVSTRKLEVESQKQRNPARSRAHAQTILCKVTRPSHRGAC